jgi:hypothetical protein
MKIQINNTSGELLFKGEFASIREAVLAALANLGGANLGGAYLSGAKGSELAIARTRIIGAGTLIGWKKLVGNRIAQLEIPAEAKRSHAFGRKCRCEFARVLAIYGEDGKPFGGEARSLHDASFLYRVGETVRPTEPFNEDWREECASGIHFYITREEAEAHT